MAAQGRLHCTMALFESFRESTARRALQREPEPARERAGVNLHQAQHIGLVYLDSDEPAFKRIKGLRKHFGGEYGTRRTQALGYVPVKEKAMPIWHTQILDLHYFNLDHLNWYRKPVAETKQFEKTPFDILIDLTDGSCLPLQFVVRRSVAKMKVGRASAPRAADYDLTLEVSPQLSPTAFVQAVEQYLAQMNFV